MKPFNLEAALRGEKVVTRDGREVTQLVVSSYTNKLIGTLDEEPEVFNTDGTYATSPNGNNADLFMYEEPVIHALNEGWRYKCNGYIVLSGNIHDGYDCYGPFPDAIKAFDFVEEHKRTWGGHMVTVSLIDPKLEWGREDPDV